MLVIFIVIPFPKYQYVAMEGHPWIAVVKPPSESRVYKEANNEVIKSYHSIKYLFT